MKRSKFSEEQIASVLRALEGWACRRGVPLDFTRPR